MKNMNGLEFDPYDFYKKDLKEQVNEKATKLIEDLTKKGNVDIDANISLSKEIKNLEKEIEEFKDKRTGHKVLRGVLIFLIIAGVISVLIGAYGWFFKGEGSTLNILLFLIGIVVIIASILINFLVINKKIKQYDKILNELKTKHQTKVNEAWKLLEGLRNGLNFKQFVDFVNSLETSIKLDYEVDYKKLMAIKNNYNIDWEFSKKESIVDVFTGSIAKNPFVRVLISREQIRDYVYEGHRVVTWTERVRGSDGKSHTVTRSQTLTATYTAPAPFYDTYSMIIYGNGAAPNLSFSRNPSGLEKDHDEKDVEKLVKKRSAEIEDLAEKAVKEGKNFTALTNNEFDALFYAVDRNNETEFRLLFTPLAQQNMIELICATDTYGDDFSFVKRNMMNYIVSYHSLASINFDYTKYYNFYDYSLLKEDYINSINSAFYSLYFDLAPILAIPLYQMNEAHFDDRIKDEIITDYEAEAFANHMDGKLFIHPAAKTKQILKLSKMNNYKNSKQYRVSSYAYDQIPQVVYIPVLCQNGRTYDVPVQWFRYDELNRETNVAISKIKENKVSETTNINMNYQKYRYHNFISLYLNEDDFNEDNDNLFAKYINMNYNLI